MTAIVASKAGHVLRDQMTWRRVRLACGLVMFTYLALHMLMHALGNVSLDAMQRATLLHDLIWHSAPGTVLLYGAFAIHFSLALYALYARRSFRMGSGELTRLVLGFSIIPLLLHHWAAGRWVWSTFGVVRKYDVILNVYFSVVPWWGWRQITVMLIAWTHGCLGIHFWLRHRSSYARYAPLLLAGAVLLPTLALLGVYQGTRAVLAALDAEASYYGTRPSGRTGDAAIRQATFALEDKVYTAYVLLLVGVLAARGVRWGLERRRGMVGITYPDGQVVRVPIGFPVLEASRSARIPHASICGGRGRCTTCRVRVLRGMETLPEPGTSERAALLRIRAAPNVRLACQLRPSRDISILPLLPADVTASDPRRASDGSTGNERFVAVMFVDIRRSTALFEKRLPYDVVFLLNCFFDAVAGAVVEAGGSPNQFIGDGLMAIFGMHAEPGTACRQALTAAQAIAHRLDAMNRRLADELRQPIAIGIGIHAGTVILGEIGYRDRRVITAIGDTVHVASRLQDLTKDYACQVIVSETVASTAGVDLSHCATHEVQVRGREAKLRIHIADDAAAAGAAAPLQKLATGD